MMDCICCSEVLEPSQDQNMKTSKRAVNLREDDEGRAGGYSEVKRLLLGVEIGTCGIQDHQIRDH